MSQIIAYEFLSLDGYFEGPAGYEMDFVRNGFIPEIEEDIARQYETVEGFVMGRRTFDSLARYWPTEAAKDEHLVSFMNTRQKLVISSSQDVSAWANSECIGSDPVAALRGRQNNAAGDLMIIGSASVVQSLTAARLVDEYRLLVFPVIVGAGRRLFKPASAPLEMILVRNHRFSNGVLSLDYRLKR